ncbi:c-type cytochrome biogenesis protein CcsB [Acidihalobacter aeolianus]|uniref:C-type cytochrome biogenesis protein CcsB n=1 Tax=Acidihalobacter aeolianus TaxID=2792603 RepID=A0A1D8K503_9GAMM|nr:c-type cytochrome biogenesis protein CcsB [Acidihalobacter aeolianus]AOV16024.1 c-type cytochrome biogenesis protein CcsB [Acidihalobacter aeolianus]
MSSVPHDLMEGLEKPSLLRQLKPTDWAWAATVLAGALFVYFHFIQEMWMWQEIILTMAAVGLIGVGWRWRQMQVFSLVVAAISLFGIWLYGSDYNAATTNPILHYVLSSPSAIAWMDGILVASTVAYLLGLVAKSDRFSELALRAGSWLAWSGVTMGFSALMIRWRESYLIRPSFGHIPVSDLFDVFVLFCSLTTLMYLYFETKYKNRALGALAMLIVSAAVGFLIYYTVVWHADKIEPLIPALQSFWMKIHVPANFIGYGAFSFSAMVGAAYLVRLRAERVNPQGRIARRLPSLDLMDEVMYSYNAVGFAFFTLATILGALWAAEAWGGYWSWDPKETWALIVWLNYAAWLHMRFTKGWRGKPMALWSLIGLGVVTFCFLGVNIWLSGLHSYGKL